MQRVVGAGLVGDRVGTHAAAHQLGQDFGRVAQQRDGLGFAGRAVFFDAGQRVVEVGGLFVDVAGAQAHVDAALLAFDVERAGAGQRRGQRLRAAHAAQARGEDPAARQVAAVVLAAHLDEGFVGALHDALAADVDPAAGGHLAVHHQALAIELVEVFPRGPVRHQVGVGDQHARRVGVAGEDADRLAALHQQGLVVAQLAQRLEDGVVAVPVARGAADAAVHHQLGGVLGHVGIEVVLQHAVGRFGEPAAAAELRAARRADGAGRVVAAGGHRRFPGTMADYRFATGPRRHRRPARGPPRYMPRNRGRKALLTGRASA